MNVDRELSNAVRKTIMQGKKRDTLAQAIAEKVRVIRGFRVMLDMDLAELYGVETKVLIQAVKRNIKRFPSDFVFRLSGQEVNNLKSQIVTSSWGGRRTDPYAFTEQGVAMLSSVLRSDQAISVNIEIMRVFVKMREMLTAHKELASSIKQLERKVGQHDEEIGAIFEVIKELMKQPQGGKKQRIGF